MENGPMSGKTVVVTGATQGIGLETALGLARLGASVAITARDAARGEEARRAVSEAGGREARLFVADLQSMAEVRRLAAELLAALPRLDVLVNNAGAIHMTRKTTPEGLEMTFAVNHLAPFLLTNLLLPRLRASAPARVVTVASEAHKVGPLPLDDLQSERGYSGWTAYGRSKLANIHFSSELARRLDGTGVTSNSLHPGVVATGFGKNDPGWLRWTVRIFRPFLLDARKGARTSIHVASSPEVEGVTGRYFKSSRVARPAPYALDEATDRGLWEASARLVGLQA